MFIFPIAILLYTITAALSMQYIYKYCIDASCLYVRYAQKALLATFSRHVHISNIKCVNVYLRIENQRKSGAAKYNSAENLCKNVYICINIIYIVPANARRNSAGLMPSYFLNTTEKYELS